MESINSLSHSIPPTCESSCERSTSLWFKDGNIVLRTRTKQYRVHQSVLGTHSSVFRDMFNVSQPGEQKMVDGCRVVDLMDSPRNWETLLSVMYGLNDLFVEEDGFVHIQFATLRAALVLGKKYDCERYRNTALHELQKVFPETLSTWDAALEIRDYYEPYAFDLLELVISFGNPEMLPSAYYSCISQCHLSDIMQRYHDEQDRPLPFEALQRLILCQQPMLNAQRDILLKWCWDGTIPSAECQSGVACAQRVSRLFRESSRCLRRAHRILENFAYVTCLTKEVCVHCRIVASKEQENGRQLVWNMIPKIFAL